jgi:GMP synthase (glutamine-hydrolysing)
VSAEIDTVFVVDFGAQYAQLIARRVREAHVYSEIVPHSITAADVAARRPAGLILSGGPKSVYVDDAPHLDPAVFDLGIPILGICYGAQLVASTLGGEVARTGKGEYGRTDLTVVEPGALVGHDQPATQPVWMSHTDTITAAPPGFRVSARTDECPAAAFDDPERRLYAVQFHPEVSHTPYGQEMLKHFLYDACQARPSWTMTSIIETAVEQVRAQVGGERVICGLSGGVDSAVAAALVHKAVGPQLTCVFVDTGLLRQGEAEQVVDTFLRHQRIELIHVRAADRFHERLRGVVDPEEKRKTIGELFIRVFEEAALGIEDARFPCRARSTPT